MSQRNEATSAAMRVVDGHQYRLRIGEIDRQPVEPVQGGKRRLRSGFGIGREEDRLRHAAAPAHKASRSSASALTTTGSSNCRTTPNGNPRSSSPPRADRTRIRFPAALRAAARRLDLPIPAGPSKTTAHRSPHRRRRAIAPPFRAQAHAQRAEPAACSRNDSRAANSVFRGWPEPSDSQLKLVAVIEPPIPPATGEAHRFSGVVGPIRRSGVLATRSPPAPDRLQPTL